MNGAPFSRDAQQGTDTAESYRAEPTPARDRRDWCACCLGGVLAVIALVTVAAAQLPYLPTDVALARGLQALAPRSIAWALWITVTADRPWCFVLLALTVVAAGLIGGRRVGAVAIPVFIGLWLFGLWLSARVAQPRPSPALIPVYGHPQGYAFPSIFGLVYVATFGYAGIVARMCGRGPVRLLAPAVAVLILAVGAVARVVLGAHWPSDLWAAYLMGFLWITVLLRLSKPRPKPEPETQPSVLMVPAFAHETVARFGEPWPPSMLPGSGGSRGRRSVGACTRAPGAAFDDGWTQAVFKERRSQRRGLVEPTPSMAQQRL